MFLTSDSAIFFALRVVGCLFLSGAQFGCELSEREDFLVGRSCEPDEVLSCDEGQVCLPHRLNGQMPLDFRCRDASSFLPTANGREPPIAYCIESEGILCPEGIECGASRIRVDLGIRSSVCRPPDDTFGPPSSQDAGE